MSEYFSQVCKFVIFGSVNFILEVSLSLLTSFLKYLGVDIYIYSSRFNHSPYWAVLFLFCIVFLFCFWLVITKKLVRLSTQFWSISSDFFISQLSLLEHLFFFWLHGFFMISYICSMGKRKEKFYKIVYISILSLEDHTKSVDMVGHIHATGQVQDIWHGFITYWLLTVLTPSISRPLEAKSVATRMSTCSSLNFRKASNLCKMWTKIWNNTGSKNFTDHHVINWYWYFLSH